MASIFTPVQYKKNPSDLLCLIAALHLWSDERMNKETQSVVIATGTWGGVMFSQRPMATLYIGGAESHQPVTGKVVLIDDTPEVAPNGDFELRLEGYPNHEYNPNVRWAPILGKTYNSKDYPSHRDCLADLYNDIANHFSATPMSTRRQMGE
jgi:hypothetical protein